MRKARAIRPGFTLVELMVVIAMVVTIVAMFFCFVLKVRDAAAASQSQNNLKQMCLAANDFAGDHDDHLPSNYAQIGEPGEPGSIHGSFFFHIIPYVEAGKLFSTSRFDNLDPATNRVDCEMQQQGQTLDEGYYDYVRNGNWCTPNQDMPSYRADADPTFVPQRGQLSYAVNNVVTRSYNGAVTFGADGRSSATRSVESWVQAPTLTQIAEREASQIPSSLPSVKQMHRSAERRSTIPRIARKPSI